MFVGRRHTVARKHVDRDGKEAGICLAGLLHVQVHFNLSRLSAQVEPGFAPAFETIPTSGPAQPHPDSARHAFDDPTLGIIHEATQFMNGDRLRHPSFEVKGNGIGIFGGLMC